MKVVVRQKHRNHVLLLLRRACSRVESSLSRGDSNKTWDDGYPFGGNYWCDYEEKYPLAEELDGSSIWDAPYVIDENNVDNYPIVPEFTPLIIHIIIYNRNITISHSLSQKKVNQISLLITYP
ncbi:MAG: hypothetical protein OEW62_04640 [Candidatus Bathyarchaeota archaeon]|nr:hypothetical protein [Candidatus Bathyarchaeota archaeon]MDH5747478.1 hypothetical protein [Candidatus Bathyarchaeota archaeon]